MKKTVVALVAVILTLALAAPAHAEALSVHQCMNLTQCADGAQTPCRGITTVLSDSFFSLCLEFSCNDSSFLTNTGQGRNPGWLSPQTLLLFCKQGLRGSSETGEAPVVMAGLSMLPYPSEGTYPGQNEPLAGFLTLLLMGCILMGIAGIIRKGTLLQGITLDDHIRKQDGYASEKPFSAGRNVTPLKPSVSAGS